jgi:hypothetical protein
MDAAEVLLQEVDAILERARKASSKDGKWEERQALVRRLERWRARAAHGTSELEGQAIALPDGRSALGSRRAA